MEGGFFGLYGLVESDYAIIAREDDPSIGVPVLVSAGLGNFRTIAASPVIASNTLAQKFTL